MIIKTTPGKTYVVESANDCTVTNPNTLAVALTVIAGAQGYFVATAQEYEVSDDAARVVQVFKLAPWQRLTLLGVLGGNTGGSALPAGYKRVEWLDIPETAGIATGFYPTNETELFIDAARLNDSYYGKICSGRGDGSNGSYGLFFERSGIIFDFHTKRYSVSRPSQSNVRYKLVAGKNGVFVDDERVIEVTPISSYTNKWQLVLFGGVNASTGTISYNSASYKIYNFIIRDKSDKIFDFVPALDPTGAPCMYDKVSRTAFYNQGSGDFLYPTESTTYALRRVLPDWGKLTEHGLRRLYHAPADWQGELYDYALEHGYKPIVEPEMPEDGYWAPRWRETEEEIILDWVETEPPTDEFLTTSTEQ